MQYKILQVLKDSDDFVSGTELGERLGVTRTAVWKGIKKLREEGYTIHAINNRGYRLIENHELYNGVELKEGLTTQTIGREIYFYEETDSTNLRIRSLALQEKPEGVIAVAELQTAGRGRREKHWTSPKKAGVWLSILLRPALTPQETPLITLLAGMAVCKAIRKTTGLPAEIKWPNDVLVREKKVCGILTEMNGEIERVSSVVVGIGVNVNMESFPKDLQDKATSLKIENGNKDCSRKAIFQGILQEFEPLYQLYLKEGFIPLYDEYKSLCSTLGRQVDVLCKEPFSGKAVGLTPKGELIIQKEDGQEVAVFSGEVSVRAKQ